MRRIPCSLTLYADRASQAIRERGHPLSRVLLNPVGLVALALAFKRPFPSTSSGLSPTFNPPIPSPSSGLSRTIPHHPDQMTLQSYCGEFSSSSSCLSFLLFITFPLLRFLIALSFYSSHLLFPLFLFFVVATTSLLFYPTLPLPRTLARTRCRLRENSLPFARGGG